MIETSTFCLIISRWLNEMITRIWIVGMKLQNGLLYHRISLL